LNKTKSIATNHRVSNHISEKQIIDHHDSIKDLIGSNSVLDLTHLKTYTIDDQNSYEIDDAISYELNESKRIVWVHISDPTTIIPKDSEIDLNARKKALSHYLAHKVIYMLPKSIIELISLKQGKVSPTLSVGVSLDAKGNILSYVVTRALINPNYNLTYEEADELIDYSPHQEKDLLILSNLMDKRRNIRRDNGAILLEQPEGRFKVRDDIQYLHIIEQTLSRKLVSECMILLGYVIALYAKRNNIAIPYRSQGFTTKSVNQPIVNQSIPAIRNSVIKQGLTRATTSLQANEHYSLGLKMYVQATSPLRRYTDMLVHRQILSSLDNNKFYSVEDLKRILCDLEPCQKQAIEIMRENKALNEFKWLSSCIQKKWVTYFLRYLNRKNSTVLLYFEELEMDISCIIRDIDSNDISQIGKQLIIEICNVDEINDLLEFRINS